MFRCTSIVITAHARLPKLRMDTGNYEQPSLEYTSKIICNLPSGDGGVVLSMCQAKQDCRAEQELLSLAAVNKNEVQVLLPDNKVTGEAA